MDEVRQCCVPVDGAVTTAWDHGGMTTDSLPPDLDLPEESTRRPWYRSAWVIGILGGVMVGMGAFYIGLIAIILLVGDRTREPAVRIGAAVLIFWWTFAVWATRSSGNGALPYVGFALLAIAAVFLTRASLERRGAPWAQRLGVTLLAGLAAALAVLQLVPFGVRSPDVDQHRALALAVEHRADGTGEQIEATQALVVLARYLVVQRPYWVVAMFEPHQDTTKTRDGEPCFGRAQTYLVDGLSGEVQTIKDILEADDDEDDDDGCLPVGGTRVDDLVELPES